MKTAINAVVVMLIKSNINMECKIISNLKKILYLRSVRAAARFSFDNYSKIKPKILIEPLMCEKTDKDQIKINVYCFNGIPKIFLKIHPDKTINIWNEKFISIDNIFNFGDKNIKIKIDDLTKKAVELSKLLAKDFVFVRVDYMLYKNKLYFEELTFTPYSGFIKIDFKNNYKIGNWIKMERI